MTGTESPASTVDEILTKTIRMAGQAEGPEGRAEAAGVPVPTRIERMDAGEALDGRGLRVDRRISDMGTAEPKLRNGVEQSPNRMDLFGM